MNFDHVYLELVLPLGPELALGAGEVECVRVDLLVAGEVGLLNKGLGTNLALEILLTVVSPNMGSHQVTLWGFVIAPVQIEQICIMLFKLIWETQPKCL